MADPFSELLQRAEKGDPRALQEMLEHHGPAIGQTLERKIGAQWRSVLASEDVMQVTYLEAFLNLDQLSASDEAGFAAWLRRIAENNLRDAIKELSRQKRPQPSKRIQASASDDSVVALLDLCGVTTTTPSRSAARAEETQMVTTALERLPEDYRTVVSRCDLEGQSIAVTAAEMGRSVGAVYMLRARALDRLTRELGSVSNFLSDSS